MAYAPQLVSLTQAGGDLDLLEALRGGRSRAKTQQEMLREQSMSPVEIGSYNGIQGKFPISQGLNKIAQGLLASYMDSQARDRAQAAADAQKDEAQKYAAGFAGAPAVQGSRPNTPEEIAAYQSDASDRAQGIEPYLGRSPVGDELPTPPIPPAGELGLGGQPAREAPTPAQRTAMILQGMVSSTPAVNRMATFLGTQDAAAQLQKERLDAQGFQAGQQRERITADRAIAAAQGQPARDEAQRLIAQDKQHRGDAVAFASAYKAASPEDQSKMLIDAQFSANPYLTKGAAHIGDMAAKVEGAQTAATAKAQAVSPSVLSQYANQLGIYKTTARTINQIDQNLARIDSGVLQFDRYNNATDALRNLTGFTNDQSRAKAEYENDVKRLAADVTQAATGTQTEFDAKRAYDLIVGNLNDPDIVRTQLRNLRQIAADSQNTAATSVNIAGKAHPGLGHEPLAMAKPLPEQAPKSNPAPGAPGTRGNPISVKTIDEALKLPPETWIRRPDGTPGQVPPR